MKFKRYSNLGNGTSLSTNFGCLLNKVDSLDVKF